MLNENNFDKSIKKLLFKLNLKSYKDSVFLNKVIRTICKKNNINEKVDKNIYAEIGSELNKDPKTIKWNINKIRNYASIKEVFGQEINENIELLNRIKEIIDKEDNDENP